MGMITYTDTCHAFDTVLKFTLCMDDEGAGFRRKAAGIFDELQTLCARYERLFSRTLPLSDISRINDAQGKAVCVSHETAQLVAAALSYCRKSGGVFDISAGCVTKLWDFKQGISPDDASVQRAIRHIGWRNIHVFQKDAIWYIQLGDAQAALDLGGIAKGWIADELGKHLTESGVSNYLINLGGNILTHGCNAQGKPWVIEVASPFSQPSERMLIRSTKGSIVTSGTYERCFRKNGVLMHHVLDPQTGYPVITDAVSATIICERSVDAEGFSTTALALGVDEGLAFCKAQPEIVSALFIDAAGKIRSFRR